MCPDVVGRVVQKERERTLGAAQISTHPPSSPIPPVINNYPTNIGIVRCTVSVATMVVVSAGGRHLSCNKVLISLTQR